MIDDRTLFRMLKLNFLLSSTINSIMTIKASSADIISDTDAPLRCCFVWHNYRVLNYLKKKEKKVVDEKRHCNYTSL